MKIDEIADSFPSKFPAIRTLLIEKEGVPYFSYERTGDQQYSRSLVRIGSITKNITGLLIGRAIEEEIFDGVDQKILAGCSVVTSNNPQQVSTVSLHQLLTMTSGRIWNEESEFEAWWQSSKSSIIFSINDKCQGTFSYDSAAVHLLGIVLAKAVGCSLEEYATKTLFKELEIAECHWEKDSQGFCYGGHALSLRPCDLLKIGEAVRNQGTHQGKKVISSSWIKQTLSPQVAGSGLFDLPYGYFWWIAPWGGFAFGHGGQFLAVNPSRQMTMVVSADMQESPCTEYYKAIVEPLLTQ
jgi:CubicO group peptidase (beta-lactamase class C family)